MGNIDFRQIMEVLVPILTIIFGGLSAYFRQHDKLTNSVAKYIYEAEEMYKDTTKAGGEKFSWVVDSLYELVPVPFKVFITKTCIEKIVQSTFDQIEMYAATQLDKAVDKAVEKIMNDEVHMLEKGKTDIMQN